MDGTRIGELHLAADTESASWSVAGVHPFSDHDVGTLLPPTFDGYARVFHPAAQMVKAGTWIDVSWAGVAAANSRTPHAGMEWAAITGNWSYLHEATQPGLWDRAPEEGSLPLSQAQCLADLLAKRTVTPDACWFGVWNGFGGALYPHDITTLVDTPQRPMILFSEPLTAVTTSLLEPPFIQLANLWWPEDRRWCVATDIDLMTTYVGGSRNCIAAIVADERLEAYEVTAQQKVTWDSDTINSAPPRRR